MCPSTCFSRTNCSLSRYNAKGKADCFMQDGVFLRLLISMFTKESDYIQSTFWENPTPLWGIYNNYKEKLSVPRVQTAAD